MLTFPPAKINLGLHITGQREDGYHNIETVFYPLHWQDGLEAIPASASDFQVYAPYSPDTDLTQNNLCTQAYQLLQEDFNLPPLEMSLLKTIPVGAGLGGGSSDGAHTLRLCNDLFDLQLSTEQLQDYALKLGSDCPFFLHEQPMLATSRGEQLSPCSVDLSYFQIAVAVPEVAIDTGWAYEQVIPEPPKQDLATLLNKPVQKWEGPLVNQFEPVIFEAHPEIAQIKEDLYQAGALYASLSGSGSAVFGIFERNHDLSGLRKQLNVPEHRFYIGN
jgi:4-diphosphocytidyl-2-C-methyl-D-erythritol kinase